MYFAKALKIFTSRLKFSMQYFTFKKKNCILSD